MRFGILILGIIAIGLGVQYYQTRGASSETNSKEEFSCLGKKYCSQMTSCKEALFYLENCPGVEMDGDGDKIPCEKEWCGHLITNKKAFKNKL